MVRAAGCCSHCPYQAATASPNIQATQNAAIQHTSDSTSATNPRQRPNSTERISTARMTMSAGFMERTLCGSLESRRAARDSRGKALAGVVGVRQRFGKDRTVGHGRSYIEV